MNWMLIGALCFVVLLNSAVTVCVVWWANTMVRLLNPRLYRKQAVTETIKKPIPVEKPPVNADELLEDAVGKAAGNNPFLKDFLKKG
jgi:hypothetical protein